MTLRSRAPLGAALLIAACSPQPETAPADPQEAVTSSAAPAPESMDDSGVPQASERQGVELAAQNLVLAEWRKASNRAECAPVSFTRTGADGTPRSANFSGGWAVAWDRPDLRSAFGVAGTGFVPESPTDTKAQRARLAAQWPLFRELPALPKPAFAGYGIEGAGDYPADNPQGRGVNSLAYIRIAGQRCDYNVWSRLGRAHLEELLDNLRLIER